MVRLGRMTAGIGFIGIGAVIAFGWWDGETAEASAEVRAHVTSVEIDNDSGSVRITTADTEVTRVQQRFRYHGNNPGDAYEMDGDALRLAGCGWNCSVDYTVTVPRGTTVRGDADSGDIELAGVAGVDVQASSGDVQLRRVNGPVSVEASSGRISAREMSGPVSLTASSGEIELADIAGRTTVEASSGSIRGERLRGSADIETSSGDITLGFAGATNVTARASSGDISLTVPERGAPYRVAADSNGAETVAVPTDAGAPHRLELSASSGDVTVRSAQ